MAKLYHHWFTNACIIKCHNSNIISLLECTLLHHDFVAVPMQVNAWLLTICLSKSCIDRSACPSRTLTWHVLCWEGGLFQKLWTLPIKFICLLFLWKLRGRIGETNPIQKNIYSICTGSQASYQKIGVNFCHDDDDNDDDDDGACNIYLSLVSIFVKKNFAQVFFCSSRAVATWATTHAINLGGLATPLMFIGCVVAHVGATRDFISTSRT